jgi:hypothetical protein
MLASLERWRGDAEVALRRMQGLPSTTRGRGTAIHALQTLAPALAQLNQSATAPNAALTAAAARFAQQNVERYEQLAARLDRVLA